MNEPVVEFHNVSKIFRTRRKTVTALNEASFTVRKGDVFGLLGANGAGKTTAMRCILGLTRISGGELLVLGRDSLDRRRLFSHAAYLPEEPQLFAGATGREHLLYFARLCGIDRSHARHRIEEVLVVSGLTESADRPISGYSKGMKQRLGIAAAVLHEPDIVFLDEPTRGLDPIGRREVRDLLARLSEQGATLFLNSHLLGEVERLCNRVAILVDGKVKAEGALADMLSEGERIVVRFALPDPAKAQFPEAQRAEGGLYTITVADTAALAELTARIASAGGRVIAAQSDRLELEDFFLRVVGKGGGA